MENKKQTLIDRMQQQQQQQQQQQNPPHKSSIEVHTAIILILAGISLGWMIGMSKSPIISSVVSTILTTFLVIISYLSGIPQKEKGGLVSNITIIPMALIIIGIGVGSIFGIHVRTHDSLSPNKERIGYLGLNKNEINNITNVYNSHIDTSIIYNRLFDLDFPILTNKKYSSEEAPRTPINKQSSAFWGQEGDLCDEYCKEDNKGIFFQQSFPHIYQLIENEKDRNEIFTKIMDSICNCS